MINRALYTSASPEWYTPPELLADIRAFLGEHLDPCPALAPGAPPRGDGLAAPWYGRVYCNPPYGRAIGRWIEKAIREECEDLILLVPARTDTAWFRPLYDYPICFVRGRLHFSGARDSAPFPSAIIYKGPRGETFARIFAKWGPILCRYHAGEER